MSHTIFYILASLILLQVTQSQQPVMAQQSVSEAYADQGQRALTRGDLRGAKRLLKKSLDAASLYSPKDPLYLARLTNNIGECYRRLATQAWYRPDPNDSDEQYLTNNNQLLLLAEKYLRASLDIKERVLEPNSLVLAKSLENLARVYYEDNKVDEAEALTRKAIGIREYKTGSKDPDLASSYLLLGDVYSNSSRYSFKDAERSYNTALRLWARASKPSDPVLGRCYEKLALIYYRSNKLELAASNYDKASLIFKMNGARCIANLAYLRKELKDLPIDCYLQAFHSYHDSARRPRGERIRVVRSLLIASRRLGKVQDVKYLEAELRSLGS